MVLPDDWDKIDKVLEDYEAEETSDEEERHVGMKENHALSYGRTSDEDKVDKSEPEQNREEERTDERETKPEITIRERARIRDRRRNANKI